MPKKLLVADDSVTIQKVIKLALSSEGYDILAVSDGREAIRAIQEERPDVVLIDVTLPGADAYEVKRAINEDARLASTGFVLLASAFERIDEKQLEEVGFHGRLIKPFDPGNLRKTISDLMTGAGAPETSAKEAPTPPPAPAELPEDLPPVQDMHPTVDEMPPPPMVSESDFELTAASAPPTLVPPPPSDTAVTEEGEAEEQEELQAAKVLENDIRNLTESTIKMSGLDEFQWSLDDSKKMKEAPSGPPSPPPSPSLGEPTRELPRPSDGATGMRQVISIPSKPIDDGGSNFPLKPPAPAQPDPVSTEPPSITIPPMTPPSGADLVSGREYVAPTVELKKPAGSNTAAPASPISRAEIEELIRKDVQAAIERVIKESVPQIAEAVIRKEIEKILAEP